MRSCRICGEGFEPFVSFGRMPLANAFLRPGDIPREYFFELAAGLCGIGPELVEFVCDTTPEKQGRLTPGSHIFVRPHAEFAARRPDYVEVLA